MESSNQETCRDAISRYFLKLFWHTGERNLYAAIQVFEEEERRDMEQVYIYNN